jgi:hypothetical protein
MCDGSDHKMCQRIPQMEPLFLLYEAGPRGFRCSSGVLLGVKPASRNSFRLSHAPVLLICVHARHRRLSG